MAENSKIEWTDHTFNPWIGCTKVSAGCTHCYAEEMMDKRYGRVVWGKGNPRQRTSEANWKLPLKWNRDAANEGVRKRVFCASLADVFDEEVPEEWLADLWVLISECRNLDWLLLTKRPQNIEARIPWSDKPSLIGTSAHVDYWKHVWLGTTAENQATLDARIAYLLSAPAAVHFLSCEPLLGPIILPDVVTSEQGTWFDPFRPNHRLCINWVIVGGESGHHARPMSIEWARSLKEQCEVAGVAYFLKQLGGTRDKRHNLEDFPEDLRVREFPQVAVPAP